MLVELCVMEQHSCAAGLQVQGQPLTQVLRPRLISGADHAWVCSAGSLLAGALQRLAGYALHQGELGDHVREILALTPVETALAAMAPPTGEPSPHSRLDGFLTADRLLFVEYGVEHLTHAWTSGGMPGDGPQVAIVECGESKVSWEFTMLQAELHRQGVPAVICSTDDLRYEPAQGGLYTRDAQGYRHPITVVYRRAVLRDLLSHYGAALTDHPLTRAWSAGACVMANSFTSNVAHKKSALALLTDPRTSGVLSPQEATAAQRHLPWTRLVRPGPRPTTGKRSTCRPSPVPTGKASSSSLTMTTAAAASGAAGRPPPATGTRHCPVRCMSPTSSKNASPSPRSATPLGQTAACASRPTTKAPTRSCSPPPPMAASAGYHRPL